MRKPKILLFDIEATNLNANFGYMLSFGYKWYGQAKTTVISVLDFPKQFKKDCTNDIELQKAIEPIFNEADMLVSWYGVRFDVPFIQTRRLLQGLLPLPPKPHEDGWYIARKRLKFNSNRLDTVSRALAHLNGKSTDFKTTLEPAHWVKGAAGDVPSIKYINHHCKMDVNVLEQVYDKLKPFSEWHPNVAIMMQGAKDGYWNCPNCGGVGGKRGHFISKLGVSQSWQCKSKKCGRWYRTKLQK